MSKSIPIKPACTLLCVLASLLCAHSISAQGPVEIDASSAASPAGPSTYRLGSATSPDGTVIGMNRSFITVGGKPWIPVMGEFHYNRMPANEWKEEILKMKAAGVQVVATYVIWIHHEEVEGKFNWSGSRDLRRFVELCGQHKMFVMVRVGPWTHGESRNGGFPDWLLKKGELRSSDPPYMSSVSRYFMEIGAQLRGLLWKDGGPIIGIQLENEFASRGKGQGDAYILALKKLAIDSGLDVPFYTVTGWDNAVVPRGQVVPVFGGYPDAPWDASIERLPPNEVYQFRFASRVSGSMEMMGATKRATEADNSDTPFITAEMGGGIEDTYHRRPVVSADDVAAMMPVMLGSGVNMYGSYMFQGGENPEGERTTLQESQDTGYPNDVPIKSYDFQAPLGQFGQEREVFRKLKVFDYFLNDFGNELAPMQVHAPALQPSSPSDFNLPRVSVRSNGSQGFVFINNHVRGHPMPARKGFQLHIKLPGRSLLIPGQPVDIPSDAYFIWPFNMNLGPALLRYSTAQLFCRLKDDSAGTWVFETVSGVRSDFVFDDVPGLTVESPGAQAVRRGGLLTLTAAGTGFTAPIKIRTASGAAIKIISLSQTQAENTWRVNFGGRERLITTTSDFFATPNKFVLRSMGGPKAAFEVYPALDQDPSGSTALSPDPSAPRHTRYTLETPEVHFALEAKVTRPAGEAEPVRIGPAFSWRPNGVAQAPSEEMFKRAEEWQLSISPGSITNLGNLFLRIEYSGDVARLSQDGRLLVDDFYNGRPWEIGLNRFSSQGSVSTLSLSILPLRKDAPIYLEPEYRPDFAEQTQAVDLKSATLVPQYQFVVTPKP